MYSKSAFKMLVSKMVETYGVRSYLNNVDDNTPEEVVNADLWFTCPECDEPILYDDYDMSECISEGYFNCPVCGETMEIE